MKHPLRGRTAISRDNIFLLFPKTKIVLTEDSTSGMEAMFYGKPLIHVHFAKSRPVLPFVEYNAALQRFSEDMLNDSFSHILNMTFEDKKRMIDGQRAFLRDFSGPCDGKAASRLHQYISEILPS